MEGSEKAPAPCTALYGAEQCDVWRRKYRFLWETYAAVREFYPCGMAEFLLDFPLETFTLAAYREHVRGLPAVEFLARQLEADPAEALTDDAALDALYRQTVGEKVSFLAFTAFVRESPRFMEEFFALAAELQIPALERYLGGQQPQIERLRQTIRNGLQTAEPLAFSEQQMGKSFRNRGPYQEFFFLPSCLLPRLAVRFFSTQSTCRRQLLFLSTQTAAPSREDTLRTLKAVADATRYQILTLLAAEGPQRGLDIARRLGLATSTISHHLDQLKEGGLLTEEPVKNAKYYGLNRKSAAAFLQTLQKDLHL